MDETWAARYPEFEREHFWWRVRRDIVDRTLHEHGGGRALDVLDIGCGAGVTIDQLAARHRVVGIEADRSLVRDSNRANEIHIGPVESMRFQGDSFDAVLLLDVLEHLDDPVRVLRLARSWTKDGGILIVMVPAFRWLWTRHDDANRHRTRYERAEVVRELTAGGWKVRHARYLFGSLIVPKLLQVMTEKLGMNGEASRPVLPPRRINALASTLLGWETRLSARVGRYWIGTSVMASATAHPIEPGPG